MNLRNIDGTQVTYKEGSHKKIIFDCDVCGTSIEQSYRNYNKQQNGKYCRNCRNKHTANRNDVKQKQSILTKNRWSDIEYRENITKKVSEARKKEWAEGKRTVSNKTSYSLLVSLLLREGYSLKTSYDDYMKKGSIISVMCSNGHVFDTNYTRFASGHRCQKCRKADFDKIYKSFSDENYILITTENDYSDNKQKLDYICPKGTKHSISWSNWQLGHRCPCCNEGMSKGEKELSDFIRSLGIDIELKNRTLIQPLELDIIIPSKKIAIEYNGLYYHGIKKGNIDKKYHLNKLSECNKIGYRLITVFEDEWETKRDIVERRLRHILTNEKGIFARKCYVTEISPRIAKEFIDKYHIQGYTTCTVKIGAYYNHQLVAVMTFAKGSVSKGAKNEDGIWELSRFCVSCSVTGIAGKLLSHFERNYKPIKIYSYADRRWSNGNVYEKIGFTFNSFTLPNYWYFKDNKKRLHRFNFRKDRIKHLATKDNMTEWHIMQEQGYDKIYDCGNIKYIKVYN